MLQYCSKSASIKVLITHYDLHVHPLAAAAILQKANLSHQRSVHDNNKQKTVEDYAPTRKEKEHIRHD